MLCELCIENLAVIEKTTVRLQMGLNVFTGETGAGKSIVIDAINAVLGQRTSREIVRHGANKALIVASFTDIGKSAVNRLSEYGYEPDEDMLIVSREISADGKSSARINGRPVTVAILKEIGAELINIHGQHDNQILLAPERHIDILDRYGDFSELQEEYHDCYRRVVQLKREISKNQMSEQEKAGRIDLLTYQVGEIDSAELKIGEDEALEEKKLKIKNMAKIIEGLSAAYRILSGDDDEDGISGLCRQASREVYSVSDYLEPAGDLAARLEGLSFELEEAASDISSQLDGLDFDAGTAKRVEARLDEIYTLKRKYGATIAEILDYCEKAREELLGLTLSDKRLAELNEQGAKEFKRLLELASKVTAKRREAANRFIATVTGELQFLDMPNVSLAVQIDKTKPNSKGQDAVEFLISTNKGEPPKPIAKIASGGELSRIMLAIKNTLADKDEIQTLIFDEIDTGVSGRAAQKIGQKLSEAARNRQIVAVTHSAQIAALCDHHFLISKTSDEKSTYTGVQKLDNAGRIGEVARIMSTDKITETMLKSAKEMIEAGKKER